ncbi:hypothetical protein LCI18_013605 [Fusarium solani-melongenae]|uniref:Uncharacterized protein n=1 Tax=Fusarium solani subsp. cucurbitae TaxID=2747967 RepID=A0ACD3ZNJ2_FUSSC|nr:hypothetical protein LCI18_013605 [Fusarium solani-melongenae]
MTPMTPTKSSKQTRQCFRAQHSVKIQSEARNILRELGIVAASSDIDISRARSAEPDADTTVPTLLNIAEWEQNSAHSWKEAVKAVASYVTTIRPLDEDTKQGLTPEEQEEDSKTRVPDAPERYSNLWEADHEGFGVRQFPETLVESPARIKHNYTIWSLDQAIRFELQAGTDPEDAAVRIATQEKADKLNFFDQDNHKLGRVVLASGFGRRAVREPATEGKRRLDWAVIEVDAARQGANMIPSFDTWKAKYQDYNLCPPRNICGTLLKPEPGSLKDIKPDETIWKVASTTGPTVGVLSPDFKPIISALLDDEYMGDHSSVESVVIGHPQASTTGDGVFSLPGDSGGIAFNKEGIAVGLVFTGQRPKQSKQGLSYVTPLDEVFDDMMAMAQSSPSQILEITLAQ